MNSLWTEADSKAAQADGWDLVPTRLNGQLSLLPMKGSLSTAAGQLYFGASEGSPLYVKALGLIALSAPGAAEHLSAALDAARPKLTVGIDITGGVVQSIFSDAPVSYFTIDYDTDDEPEDKLTWVPQDDGSDEQAIVSRSDADVMPQRVREVVAAFDEQDAAEDEPAGMRP